MRVVSPQCLITPLYGLVLKTILFREMSLGVSECRDKLDAADYLSSQIKHGIRKVDFFSACARAGGPSEEIDVKTRSSGNFDLGRGLLEVMVKVSTKTDPPQEASDHSSCLYNQLSGKLVGGYENWDFHIRPRTGVWRLPNVS